MCFDTFSGCPKTSKEDKNSNSIFIKEGGFGIDSYTDLKECIKVFDAKIDFTGRRDAMSKKFYI